MTKDIPHQLICIDFDGVILDSLASWVTIVQLAQAKLQLGRAPEIEDFRVVEDLSNPGMARHLGIPETAIPQWEIELKAAVKLVAGKDEPFPEIVELVKTVSKLLPVCIITSNFEEEVARHLARLGLSDSVSAIIGAEAQVDKTAKLLSAAEKFKVTPEQIIFVGDTRSDMRHGRAAGSKTVGVTWGFQARRTLWLEHPDLIVDTPQELARALEAAPVDG